MASAKSKPSYDSYFCDPALTKAYYIPTETIQLSGKQKKLAMSPHRIPEKESGIRQPITPETQAYLRQVDYAYNTEKGMPSHSTPSPPSTLQFDESWPSSDKPSILSEESKATQNKSDYGSNYYHSPNTDDSVLSKYLRRFRNAPPQRREERKAPSLSEFWWGTSSKSSAIENSSIVTQKASGVSKGDLTSGSGAKENSHSSDRATDNSSGDRDFEESSSGTPSRSRSLYTSETGKRIHFEPATPKTKALMDRTNELLGKSDTNSESNATPPVSSEGMTDSDQSSLTSHRLRDYKHLHHSTPEEDSVRPILHRNNAKVRDRRRHLIPADDSGKTRNGDNPENDILYQWRLKRRMELAQQKVKDAEMQAKLSRATDIRVNLLSGAGRDLARAAGNKQTHSTATQHVRVATVVAQHDECETAPPHSDSCKTATPQQSANDRLSSVEKIVQTDAELAQSATQTTPTVDPIAACTGSSVSLPTHTLSNRIQSCVSPSKAVCDVTSSVTGHQHRCSKSISCQPTQHCGQQHVQSCPGSQCCLCSKAGTNCPKLVDHPEAPSCAERVGYTEVNKGSEVTTPKSSVRTRLRGGHRLPERSQRQLSGHKASQGQSSSTPVSRLISQVATQRLFSDPPNGRDSVEEKTVNPGLTVTDPESTLTSSSHTLAHVSSLTTFPDEIIPPIVADNPVPDAENLLTCSDEEFADDELLVELRKRRDLLVSKLEDIDEKLSLVS